MSSSDATHRSALLVVVVVLALLSAGCVALFDDGVSRADLEERLGETDAPDEIAATVEITETVDGVETHRTQDVWLRADGASRIETTENGSELLIVTDGTERYHHDRETGAVRSFEVEPNATSYLEGIYAQPERYVDAYEVTAIEETAIDDRDVYHVTFEPPADETVERSIDVLVGQTEYVLPLETSETDAGERSADRVELWLDRQTLFPVKHVIAGDGVELETTYRDLSIDEGLDDELFEPPEAADGGDEHGELELPSIDHHESVDEADSAVPFSVAEPEADTLPDGVELEGISRYEFPDEERTQVTLTYRNGDDESVMVTTSDGQRQFATDGRTTVVGNATGTMERTAEGTELQWSCDGLYYSVFADEAYESQTATAVGESLPTDC